MSDREHDDNPYGAVDPDRVLFSLGWICQHLQTLPQHVAVMAKHCEIAPAFVLDGTPFFTAAQVVTMSDTAAKIRKEVVESN